MMGVYIEGMEMPKEGSWTTVRIYPDGTCAVPNWQGDCTLIKGAKAVHVPPHGRLGDLDKLENGLRHMAKYQFGERQQGILGCCETIRLAPTIIPAEPAKPRELRWREWNYIVPEEGE